MLLNPRNSPNAQAEANITLLRRSKRPTTWEELELLLVFHILCSTYKQAPSKVASEEYKFFYFQMGVDVGRYKEVLSSLSETNQSRVHVTHGEFGWSLKSRRAICALQARGS